MAPYKLDWIQKEIHCLTISQNYVLTIVIGPFRDIMVFDASPLDCVDILLKIPYQ